VHDVVSHAATHEPLHVGRAYGAATVVLAHVQDTNVAVELTRDVDGGKQRFLRVT